MEQTSFVRSISGRLLLLGVLPTVLIMAAIIGWNALDGMRSAQRAEEQVLAADAGGAAAELSVRNDRWNAISRTMAESQVHGLFGKRAETSGFGRAVNAISTLNISAFFVYEPNADGKDAASLNSDLPKETMDASGRFMPVWYSDVSDTGTDKLRAVIHPDAQEYYQSAKDSLVKGGKPQPVIAEPRAMQNTGLVITHCYPIVIDGKFAGVAGVDRTLRVVSQLAGNIKKRSGAEVFILSPHGVIIAATEGGAVEGQAGGPSGGLEGKKIAETAYAPVAGQWASAVAGGSVDVYEAVDPQLKESCFYGVEKTQEGGWTVVVRRTKAEVMHASMVSAERNLAIGTLAVALVCALMYVVTSRIVGRVRGAAAVAGRIAGGDLTVPVAQSASTDETGLLMRSMHSMDANLNTLVGNVKQASISLNSAATEIAATSKQQEASSSTFGAASSQIAAAVKEISATGRDLVKTMESVNRMTAETAELAGSGRAGLHGIEGVMRDLDGATATIASKLSAISERSEKITTVVTTITKVADQTNILSINAAIEAERAGEYGAGFLVIAREIRRLADQTAGATLDIESMVKQMQSAVSEGVMEMDRFSDQVRRGVREVGSAGTQLTEIIERVNRSTESFKQVNESTQAQSEGAQQISDAMGSLVSNANQTLQSAREFSRAAGDLHSAIALLRQAVAQFKLRE